MSFCPHSFCLGLPANFQRRGQARRAIGDAGRWSIRSPNIKTVNCSPSDTRPRRLRRDAQTSGQRASIWGGLVCLSRFWLTGGLQGVAAGAADCGAARSWYCHLGVTGGLYSLSTAGGVAAAGANDGWVSFTLMALYGEIWRRSRTGMRNPRGPQQLHVDCAMAPPDRCSRRRRFHLMGLRVNLTAATQAATRRS